MPTSSIRAMSEGSALDVVSVEVEAGKVMEFAKATHAADPVHTDADAAAAAGFSSVPATPTHVVVAGHHRNQKEFVQALGLAIERVVVGSVEWEYRRPLVVGDRLTGTRRVVDDTTREGRRGGVMRLVTLETAWVDDTGATALTQREVLIERSAMSRTPISLSEGDELETREIGPITQTDIVRFAGAGGDFNPLHHDSDYARRAGLPGVISMGQMQAGMLAAWVADQVHVENMLSFSVRFASPLAVGETVEFSGRVTSLDVDDAVAELDLEAKSADRVVITGKSRVKVAAAG